MPRLPAILAVPLWCWSRAAANERPALQKYQASEAEASRLRSTKQFDKAAALLEELRGEARPYLLYSLACIFFSARKLG